MGNAVWVSREGLSVLHAPLQTNIIINIEHGCPENILDRTRQPLWQSEVTLLWIKEVPPCIASA